MKTPDAIALLPPADVAHLAERAQGLNELRALLGVGGRLGSAESASDERAARAALDGLQDGMARAGDQGECFGPDERPWYLAALAAGERAAATPVVTA
jgi:hypothetical protein